MDVGSLHFAINDVSLDWDENTRRVDKACKKCGKPTKGRAVNVGGIKTPAHMSCAVDLTVEKALQVYGKE